MEDKPEAHIPYVTGGIVKGPLHGVIACGSGGVGYLIPPKRHEASVPEPYDERESQP